MARWKSWGLDDEEADERARLTAQWEGERDSVASQLGPGGGDRTRTGFRLADEPARHGSLRRPLAALMLDPPAETVLVPVDERAPGDGPRLPDAVEEVAEDRASVRRVERRPERLDEPLRACTRP